MARSASELLSGITGFEWDAANATKLWSRHTVGPNEAEEVALNRPFLIEADLRHSDLEPRFRGLGRTDDGRFLFVVFSMRGTRVRFISARPMSRKEQRAYVEAAEAAQADPEARDRGR
jgi:uncharacterized DUF497 family protein